MCDFYSEIGRVINGTPETYHDATNSHSQMVESVKWRGNEPNRKTLIFEFECTLETLLSDCNLHEKASSLIRNFGECPEPLVTRFINQAIRVREAIKSGKHLSPDGFFFDTKKYCDVWSHAVSNGAQAQFPEVFHGNLTVYGSAKLDAPALKEVGGNLAVSGSAKLDALVKVGGEPYKK